MIGDFTSLKAHILRRMDRDDLESDAGDILCSAISRVTRALAFNEAETSLEVAPTARAERIKLPDGFLGMTELRVGGQRYLPSPLSQLRRDANRYAVGGGYVYLFPGIDAGTAVVFWYRSFARGGEAGEGVSVDRLRELFVNPGLYDNRPRIDILPEDAATIDPNASGPGELASNDAYGRDEVSADEVVGSLDHLDEHYNPVDRLIRRFPDAFLNASLAEAYDFVQDFASSDRYRALEQAYTGNAAESLMNEQYGGEKLTIRSERRGKLAGYSVR